MCDISTNESFEGLPNIVVWYHKILLPTVKKIVAIEPKLPTLREIESMNVEEIENLIDNYKS